MIQKFLLFVDAWLIFILAVGILADYLNRGLSAEERIPSCWKSYYPLFLGMMAELILRLGAVNSLLILQLIRFLTAVLALAVNYRRLGFNILLIGIASNLLVKIANGGQMPVFFQDIASDSHIFIHADTNFKILSDVIRVGGYYMSIGDICVYVGAVLFCLCQVFRFFKLKLGAGKWQSV